MNGVNCLGGTYMTYEWCELSVSCEPCLLVEVYSDLKAQCFPSGYVVNLINY